MSKARSVNSDPPTEVEPDRLPVQLRSFSAFPWQIVAVGAIALFLGFVLSELFWLIARPLALLLVAIVIASALAPIVDYLSRWAPRVLAIIGVYLVLLAMLVGLGWIVFPPMVDQARTLIVNGPEIVEQVRNWIDQWGVIDSSRIVETLESRVSQYAGTLADLPLAIISTVLDIVLVIFMSIYWLIAMPSLRRFMLSLVPEASRQHADHTLAELGATMGGYVRGAIISGVVVGIFAYIGLSVIGVQYAIVLAVTAGLFELVPVVGPIAASVPIVGLAFLDSPTTGIITLVFWVVVQQLESQILTPVVMRSQADIHPLLVIFAVFVGGELGGIVGALVAIPLAGALSVLFVRVMAPWIRRWAGVVEPGSQAGKESS